jgi:hypothetical protein
MAKMPHYLSSHVYLCQVELHHTVISNFGRVDYLKLFQPHNMPKAPIFDESRMIGACEAAQPQRNISKTAREYIAKLEMWR